MADYREEKRGDNDFAFGMGFGIALILIIMWALG